MKKRDEVRFDQILRKIIDASWGISVLLAEEKRELLDPEIHAAIKRRNEGRQEMIDFIDGLIGGGGECDE